MRGLINYLKENPDVAKVHFNANGGWLIDGDRLHTIPKSREEILALEASLPLETVTKDDLSGIQDEYTLLREKIELLEVENQILKEGKDKDTEEWAKERAAFQTKIGELETKLTAASGKNKKFNATT